MEPKNSCLGGSPAQTLHLGKSLTRWTISTGPRTRIALGSNQKGSKPGQEATLPSLCCAALCSECRKTPHISSSNQQAFSSQQLSAALPSLPPSAFSGRFFAPNPDENLVVARYHHTERPLWCTNIENPPNSLRDSVTWAPPKRSQQTSTNI